MYNHFALNEDESTTHQHSWDTARAVLRGVCSTGHICTKEQSQIHQLSFPPREAKKKEEQVNSKVSRREDTIEIIAEIDEIETRKLIEKHQ